MPQVEIKTVSGPVLITYTISTPKSENASSIDPRLPTILFLHPVYIGHAIFHHQFASPKLRRFNLVGFDARLHGATVGTVPSNFRRTEAAEDVALFMEALRLPPCHLVGISLGACVALQTSISHPDKVLSVVMLAPLSLEEPEAVRDGRQEIYDCWVEGCREEQRHEDALLDAIFGALQLGFNRSQASIVSALVQVTLSHGLRNWAPAHFEEFHTISVKFFVDRHPHPLSALQKIRCPVHLVHCGGDIAYPLHCAEELRQRFEEAGVDVKLSQVKDASHFGCVTHPEEINTVIHDWVIEATPANVPRAKATVKSPFEAELREAGLTDEGPDDSDDDLFVVAAQPISLPI